MPEEFRTVFALHDIMDAAKKAYSDFEDHGPVWFRGMACESWELLPSVYRKFTLNREHMMFEQFRLQAPSRYGQCPQWDDLAAWICLMRHYGLPTRLLD